MDTLVKKAYENWIHVVEYDGKSLLSYKQTNSSDAPQTEAPRISQDYSNSFDQQFTLPALPVPVPSDQPTMDSSLSVGGILLSTEFINLFVRLYESPGASIVYIIHIKNYLVDCDAIF